MPVFLDIDLVDAGLQIRRRTEWLITAEQMAVSAGHLVNLGPE